MRPRVHEILAEPFITSKIEGILSPEDLIEEFSHTIIHSNAPAARRAREQRRLRRRAGGRAGTRAVWRAPSSA